MIVLLTTAAHRDTHRPLKRAGRFALRIRSYAWAWRSFRLPRATYIFTDLDRLGYWELELAGRLYRQLAAGGARVLNDPARLRQRYSFLRTLKARGLNRFNVWRVEDTPGPDQFPVFLRTESAHRKPLSGLLHNQAEVDQAVDAALDAGVPRRELLLVEYCAEPICEGLFRKLAMYRVGDRLVPSLSVHDTGWSAKSGQIGVAGQELYNDEYDIVASKRYADQLWPVFEAGQVEYGRADFGLVQGEVQVYEINTNPRVRQFTRHPFPIRVEAGNLAFEKLVQAFEAIDMPSGGRIRLDDKLLRRQRRRSLLMLHSRWVP